MSPKASNIPSEDLVRAALDVAGLGVWEWCIEENTLYWSDELKEIYGIDSHETVTYDKYTSMLHPADAEHMKAVIESALKTGQPYTIEHRIIWPDTSEHWVMGQGKAFLKDGEAYRMLGTAMNIDDRKHTEEQLQESEERFRNMADTAPVMIWMSGLDKRGTYFNKPWLTYTGRTVEQEQGEGWADNIHPDDIARCLKIYKEAFNNRKTFSMEFRLKRHDNEYRWLLGNGAPRFAYDGTFLGYIGSCTDIENVKSISKRKDELEGMYDELENEHDELIALNQSKDEFISLASHQLRTPATGVKQYIGMLIEGYAGKLTTQQNAMLQTAYTSNERQLSIIDDLLRVAHVDSGKVILHKSKTNIHVLLKDVLKEQQSKFKKRQQKVVLKQQEPKISAFVDSDRLRMVLENIIDNASKYTLDGNPITVIVDQTDDMVRIKVKDRGIGISSSDIPKLFKKFSRISNSLSTHVSGTGLGLYWAEKIITLHEGSIKVSSKPNVGTTFTISIPK